MYMNLRSDIYCSIFSVHVARNMIFFLCTLICSTSPLYLGWKENKISKNRNFNLLSEKVLSTSSRYTTKTALILLQIQPTPHFKIHKDVIRLLIVSRPPSDNFNDRDTSYRTASLRKYFTNTFKIDKIIEYTVFLREVKV